MLQNCSRLDKRKKKIELYPNQLPHFGNAILGFLEMGARFVVTIRE
jgi:hypothetical protein